LFQSSVVDLTKRTDLIIPAIAPDNATGTPMSDYLTKKPSGLDGSLADTI
jgi:hypothetical protein